MGRLEFHERRAPMMAQRHSAIALLALAFATKSQGQPETMTPTTLLESSNSTINRGMYMQAFVYLYGHGSCTNDLPTLQRRIRLGQCTNNTVMRTSMIVTTGETTEGFPFFDVQVPICHTPPRPPQAPGDTATVHPAPSSPHPVIRALLYRVQTTGICAPVLLASTLSLQLTQHAQLQPRPNSVWNLQYFPQAMDCTGAESGETSPIRLRRNPGVCSEVPGLDLA